MRPHLIIIFSFLALQGCTSGNPKGTTEVIMIISFALAVLGGLLAMFHDDDNKKLSGASVGFVFLIVALLLLA